MNYKAIFLMLLAVGLLLAGCAQSSPPSGYASSGGQAQQQQYVGGGCGLASPDEGDAAQAVDSGAAAAA